MIIDKFKHEIKILPYILNGYNRKTASRWLQRQENDYKWYSKVYSRDKLKEVHKKGFRAKRIESFSDADFERYVNDLDYLALDPINNNYGKWISDYNTFKRVAIFSQEMFPEIYYSFFRRGRVYANTWPAATEKISIEEIIQMIKSHPEKAFEFRPAFFKSTDTRHVLQYISGRGIVHNGGSAISESYLKKIITQKTSNYLMIEHIKYMSLTEDNREFFIKFYITNDSEEPVVSAILEEIDIKNDTGNQYLIDLKTGYVKELGIQMSFWERILDSIRNLNRQIRQIRFYTISVVAKEDGKVIIKSASDKPFLPRIPYNNELLECLKSMVAVNRTKKDSVKIRVERIKRRIFEKWVSKHCPKGMRPYMEKMWLYSLRDDLKYKGTTLREKLWSWKRGYQSFRIEQYGLTEENYKNFLSDYQYHWLNRINNVFQLWINDKTTFRYVMNPYMDNIPKYYFNIFKLGDNKRIEKMMDCPDDIENSFDGIIDLLEKETKLVFKASAGTHGDGFYCLEFKDDLYYANGNEISREELKELIACQKSYYLVTSYIEMSSELKRIYPTSVNTIRVAVVNRSGYNPEIMQTYMRIGSSKTGYTDNVGYGGICAMIDIETGKLYNPEKLIDHKYLPCDVHPDTGFQIDTMVVPHWDKVCEGVKSISRLIPEIEYLGFDVAVTEDSFEIVEINIHQDLHKVAQHSEKYKQFYRDKLRYKMAVNRIHRNDKVNKKILYQ